MGFCLSTGPPLAPGLARLGRLLGNLLLTRIRQLGKNLPVGETNLPITHVHPHGLRWELHVEHSVVQPVHVIAGAP
jgi:hypothetical protein